MCIMSSNLYTDNVRILLYELVAHSDSYETDDGCTFQVRQISQQVNSVSSVLSTNYTIRTEISATAILHESE